MTCRARTCSTVVHISKPLMLVKLLIDFHLIYYLILIQSAFISDTAAIVTGSVHVDIIGGQWAFHSSPLLAPPPLSSALSASARHPQLEVHSSCYC